MPTLITLRLPLAWADFDLPSPLQTRTATLQEGPPAWAWDDAAPELGIPACGDARGAPAPGWDLDHAVLLVPSLDEAVEEMQAINAAPRLRLEVKGRPTAFFRVGPVLEVIQSPVRAPAIYGVALVTEEPLETVALRWRSLGLDVTDPRDAIQPGRRIMTVRATAAGLAVMSPDRSR